MQYFLSFLLTYTFLHTFISTPIDSHQSSPSFQNTNLLFMMMMKTSKKKMMRGFMCQSTAVTTACMVTDPRSIIVPTTRNPNKILINNAKYSRLAVPSINKRKQDLDQETKLKPLNKLPPPPPPPPPVASSDQLFQVVVMRVSLHCQGCAGKVKKHLSKMEGVTSFSIDVETKRVTVMGHVSPAGVLESISKVKKAEFWP